MFWHQLSHTVSSCKCFHWNSLKSTEAKTISVTMQLFQFKTDHSTHLLQVQTCMQAGWWQTGWRSWQRKYWWVCLWMLLCLCGKHHKVAGDKETWAYKGTFVVSVWWSGCQSLMPLPKDRGTTQHGENKSCFAPICHFSNVTEWWTVLKKNNQKRSKVKAGWCLVMFVYMEIWREKFYRSAFMFFYMKFEGKGFKVVFS